MTPFFLTQSVTKCCSKAKFLPWNGGCSDIRIGNSVSFIISRNKGHLEVKLTSGVRISEFCKLPIHISQKAIFLYPKSKYTRTAPATL